MQQYTGVYQKKNKLHLAKALQWRYAIRAFVAIDLFEDLLCNEKQCMRITLHSNSKIEKYNEKHFSSYFWFAKTLVHASQLSNLFKLSEIKE